MIYENYYPGYVPYYQRERKEKIKKFLKAAGTTLLGFGLGVAVSQNAIHEKNNKIKNLEMELNKTKSLLNETFEKYTELENKYSMLDELYSNTSGELDNLVEKYEYCEQNKKLLKDEFENLAIKYENLKKEKPLELYPTFEEVVKFLKEDKTEKMKYELNKFDCTQFSWTLIRNAMKKGMYAGIVNMEIREEYPNGTFIDYMGHNLVVFKTKDRGIVYVEPQNDVIVTEDGERLKVYDEPVVGSFLEKIKSKKVGRMKRWKDYCEMADWDCEINGKKVVYNITKIENVFECDPYCSDIWLKGRKLLEKGYFPNIEEIEMEDGSGFYLLGINTKDKGKIYYDPLFDKLLKKEIHIGDNLCDIRPLPEIFCKNKTITIRESHFDCENKYHPELCSSNSLNQKVS